MGKKALEGLKVLEMGQLIAGPFAARLLAEFGAEVIKVEPPAKGDPIRSWRVIENGTSLWWYVQSRNKKCITIDLKHHEGQELIRGLVKEIDILIENFRPGTLEKWGLGYEELKKINPGLVMIRVSGYGQDGPYKDKPGFGSIGEAMGGLRYITGYPDRPPVRVGVSIGDSLSSLYAVIGALMAVYHRDVHGTGEGQVIDVALYESVFSLMESVLPEYDRAGLIRERSGSMLPGITPSNTYVCSDGTYIVIGANGDAIFKRLMYAMGREDIAEDQRFENNAKRSEHAEFLDGLIEEWTKSLPFEVVKECLDKAGVPAGSIYSVEDIVNDPHYQARKMIQEVAVDGLGMLKMPGIVPKLSETPGEIVWAGPELGQHTEDVLGGNLGLTEAQIKDLKAKGVI
ncbi:crotonobetainyl-CoA:carnitine CoA-transferase CaiB-like acyl-CoA transferase [Neobacillus niacini]|jgi:crotonobetainyl-CoA:carnitine CoA-transferase CaiB-like acyl-CoA transferase|uniref:CaiB/BaiF CoA transferase family protein n=1 Tax=Neobacillus niacini TaxID=86668 RepID=UPI0027878143|nr:CaiB/BaiF CoA-transferase family protein [Neobacillus niacini]MDQ1004923.1 crotonobetainyl-CoA:carnitine CoA-transferase CaiB-like acyl-CoA transferase [Neobacillus niacini]